MADNSKPGLGGAAAKAIAAAPSAESDRRDLDRSAIEPSDRFVALDIGALALLAGDDPNSAPTQPLVKSFSRKGSQRNGGGGDATSPGGPGEKPTIVVHVAGDGGQNGHFITAPTATTPGGKCRRASRRHSPWLDPRRVLFVFATLSSMGTLILLYFTLSMGKMTQGDSDA